MDTPEQDQASESADASGARTWRVGGLTACVAVLAIAVYANSLRNGLVYDDFSVITANEAVRDAGDLRTIFLTPSWFARANPTIAYRPFTTWTFALNHAVHGLDPWGYHLVNVVAHAAVSVLVLVLANALGLPMAAAALAAALFAVHPIHTEAVANVVGRAEVLAAAFAVCALILHRSAAARGRPGPWLAGATVAYALALLSKENTVALVAALPLADFLSNDGGSPRLFLHRLRGSRAIFYGALAVVTAAYIALRIAALGGLIGAEGANLDAIDFHANPSAQASTGLRILTALKVQAFAIWLLFVPFELSADYSYRQISVVASLAEPGAIAGLIVAGTLVVLAGILWRTGRVAFFWLALAGLTYGIVSNIVLPIGTIFGERLLYLPSVGFCALLATALAGVAAGFARPWGRALGATVAVALLVAWGARTVTRNPVWYSARSLAEATVASAPHSVHAHHLLGTVYAKRARDADALAAFGRALEIDPEHIDSFYDIGVIYQRQGKLVEALAMFQRVVERDPEYFPAWINIGAANNHRGSFLPALGAADRAITVRADIPNAHVVRGFALRGLERRDEARAAFEEALRIAPRNGDALLGLGATAVEQDQFELAISAFERLVELVPSLDAYRGLVFSYRQAGRRADAARLAAVAREKFPDDRFFRP